MAATQSGNPNLIGSATHILTVPQEVLSELGRATTAYYEATPDMWEQARREYEEALRQFNATREVPQL